MEKKLQQVKTHIAETYEVSGDIFDRHENQYVVSDHKYFEMVSFGKDIVFFGNEQMLDFSKTQFHGMTTNQVMDGRNLYLIDHQLRQSGYELSGEHLRFIRTRSSQVTNRDFVKHGYYFRFFHDEEITELYQYQKFENALDYETDKIAYGVFFSGELVALCAADNKLGKLWQIGVDVKEHYRGKGLGAVIVNSLANEIERRGFIPFYTTKGSNLPSMKIAIRAGFTPAWIGYYSVALN